MKENTYDFRNFVIQWLQFVFIKNKIILAGWTGMSVAPRLSGALRVYTGLSEDTGGPSQSNDLWKKRQLVTKKKTAVEGL